MRLASLIGIALLALCVPAAAAPEPASCRALEGHPAAYVYTIGIRQGIHWNGGLVSRAQFAAYLKDVKQDRSFKPVFHFIWADAEASLAHALMEEVRRAGYEVASHCRRIPY